MSIWFWVACYVVIAVGTFMMAYTVALATPELISKPALGAVVAGLLWPAVHLILFVGMLSAVFDALFKREKS